MTFICIDSVFQCIGMMRPRVQGPNPHPMMRGQAQGFPPFPQQNHPGNIRIMRTTAPMQPHSQPMNMRPSQPPQPLMSVGGPRKVLINPNFKGGVQAATSKYIPVNDPRSSNNTLTCF